MKKRKQLSNIFKKEDFFIKKISKSLKDSFKKGKSSKDLLKQLNQSSKLLEREDNSSLVKLSHSKIKAARKLLKKMNFQPKVSHFNTKKIK